jgi:hydroxymethylpyrimidine pyrophosphatase-like HAD family hydrolase
VNRPGSATLAGVTIELVVTDLDGTFWDGDDEVHPRTLAAVAELERRGIPLLVATGRRQGSARGPLARAGLLPPAVLLNGSLCLDLATGDRFHQQAFEPETAALLLEAWLAVGIEPVVYVDHPDIEVVVGDRPSTHPRHLAEMGPLAVVGNLADTVANMPILALAVIGCDETELGKIAASVAGRTAEILVPSHGHYPGHNLHHWPLGLSKWDGVEAYCRLAGLDPSKVLALGDSLNDLELLANAALSCVPSNGHPVALAAATHVIGPPDAGGWAELLDIL